MRPFALQLYGLASRALSPLAPSMLTARVRAGREDPDRLGERLGHASRTRPPGPLVWLHGASLGEGLSLAPLIARLADERPDIAVLATSGVRTSAQVMARRLPASVIHQCAPIDAPAAVARFLDHWRPDLGIFVESELWPNLILAAQGRGVRLALVSARLSRRTQRRWAGAGASAAKLLGAFDLILAQDADNAARIAALGGRVAGELNLKHAAAPLPFDPAELARLKAAIDARPVILALSTHAGEEVLIADAVAALTPATPPRLLILAPRHPARAGEIAGALAAKRLSFSRRSAGETIGPQTAIYLADTLGDVGLLARAADIVVMGGGFTAGIGGHNPLEPARLETAILSGPHVANFETTYAALNAAGAVALVRDGADLTGALQRLLADPARRREMAAAALGFASDAGRAFGRAWSRLAPLLPAP